MRSFVTKKIWLSPPHGRKKKKAEVSNNCNVEIHFYFSSQSWLGGPSESTVKILQAGCKQPPFLQHSLNLKQVQHLEIINVPNNFLWHAALFHMKELLWNTFSQSVLYLQLHRHPELLSFQVIADLPQGQVNNKAADVFLPNSSLLKSNMKSLCIFRCQD